MSALLVLIVVLAVHSFTLSGVGEGIRFYLVPNMKTVQAAGLKNVITAAMNQSFFTLSLGVAAMEIFGSYMGKNIRWQEKVSASVHWIHLWQLWPDLLFSRHASATAWKQVRVLHLFS